MGVPGPQLPGYSGFFPYGCKSPSTQPQKLHFLECRGAALRKRMEYMPHGAHAQRADFLAGHHFVFHCSQGYKAQKEKDRNYLSETPACCLWPEPRCASAVSCGGVLGHSWAGVPRIPVPSEPRALEPCSAPSSPLRSDLVRSGTQPPRPLQSVAAASPFPVRVVSAEAWGMAWAQGSAHMDAVGGMRPWIVTFQGRVGAIDIYWKPTD